MVRYLYDEPHFLLQQEVSEVGSYFSIIKAIAAGNHKLSAIAAVLEVKSTNLTKYLKTLMDLDIGVYLDSTLLENLTAKEREQMVKERVKELGGQLFTAYDGNGNAVDVQIAAPNACFVNKNGKSVPVNKDLATKNRGSRIKQEAVVLADELVSAARYKKSRPANYPHGWLDDTGRNEWAEWKTYIQNKENSVWEATLHIATSATGEKFLYDIDPIKVAEQSENSDTSTAQSTPPARGATCAGRAGHNGGHHFNPRPPRGGRLRPMPDIISAVYFNPRPPARGATTVGGGEGAATMISIHAPHEGGRRQFACRGQQCLHISIHAPTRGATFQAVRFPHQKLHFNPRPPRGGRRLQKRP